MASRPFAQSQAKSSAEERELATTITSLFGGNSPMNWRATSSRSAADAD
jgi:hypothetical protein